LSLQALLEPLDENIVLAASGTEALREVLRKDFALILMDAEMPGMDGFETAEFIRGRPRTSSVPIIFVTAHGMERKQMFRSYSVGAVDFIAKPFDPDILRSKVAVFVDLYKKSEEIKRQAELIHESELRDANRRQQELQEAMEREHMKNLAEELEKRVEERTSELIEANAEMEAFCYSVSHDLRAPLRTISATSHMLLQDAGPKLDEDERTYLDRQAAAAHRLAELIDDLLQLSRLGRKAMRRQNLDLSQVAQTVGEEVLARPWTYRPELRIQPGLKCNADPGLLRVLLDNLLDNACKYSPEGGVVEVGSSEPHVFFVRDQGIGFEMTYAEKVFKPFERLVGDKEYDGTGIGLAIVHRIVMRHGGSIWVDSQPGRGTTFYFTLGKQPAPVPPVQVK
jgi:two-component system, sensor histidine kinase and response regulator